MKLAPRMIQSMEILQLPLAALQERIDQELAENVVLEQLTKKDERAEPAESAELNEPTTTVTTLRTLNVLSRSLRNGLTIITRPAPNHRAIVFRTIWIVNTM